MPVHRPSWDDNESALKKYAESLGAESEKDMTQLKSALDQSKQAFATAMDIIREMQERENVIIRNMMR